MRVFIWVSYGNVSVMQADNTARLQAIYDKIAAVLNDFTEDEQAGVKNVDEWLASRRGRDDLKVLERAILMLIDSFGGYDVHETFEHGTGFDNLEDPLNNA